MNHEVHWTFDDVLDQQALEAEEARLTRHQEGVEARDRAIEKADAGADPLWLADAMVAVKAVAYAQETLTSEDVSDQLERSTPELRALGSVMRCAADRGWIRATDRFVPAEHPSRHKAPVRVWSSQIFAGEWAA